MHEPGRKFEELIEIVNRLRQPGGCPWDMKQTPQTLKKYVLEETHELLEAIDSGNPDDIKTELGDLLFQVVLLTRLYSETGGFSITDSLDSISAKMIRRHPHVFGNATYESEEELRRNWHAIKKEENKGKAAAPHMLESIPKSLPALSRAHRVSERAARTGFEWPDCEAAVMKLEEEVLELKKALHSKNTAHISEEIGDLLLTMTNISRLNKINAEEALQAGIAKFIKRFKAMEELLPQQDGRAFSGISPDDLIALWRRAKETGDR